MNHEDENYDEEYEQQIKEFEAFAEHTEYHTVQLRTPAHNMLKTLLVTANDKPYGRKIRSNDLIKFALESLQPTQIQELQAESIRGFQRLNREYAAYLSNPNNPRISKDEYLGQILKKVDS